MLLKGIFFGQSSSLASFYKRLFEKRVDDVQWRIVLGIRDTNRNLLHLDLATRDGCLFIKSVIGWTSVPSRPAPEWPFLVSCIIVSRVGVNLLFPFVQNTLRRGNTHTVELSFIGGNISCVEEQRCVEDLRGNYWICCFSSKAFWRLEVV